MLSGSAVLSTGVAAQTSNSITDLIPLIPTCAVSDSHTSIFLF